MDPAQASKPTIKTTQGLGKGLMHIVSPVVTDSSLVLAGVLGSNPRCSLGITGATCHLVSAAKSRIPTFVEHTGV